MLGKLEGGPRLVIGAVLTVLGVVLREFASVHGRSWKLFRRIRLLSAISKADTRANSEACSEIPHSIEQRIFAKEQGICLREQGN